MSHNLSLVGQIATDPKFFTPQGGAEFCTFRLASTERRYDANSQEWVDGDTNWFTVNTFRSLARHANRSFKKGDRVVLTGKLRVRTWEKDEKRGTSVEVDAEGIGHDVRFGVSAFTKAMSAEAPAGQPTGAVAAPNPHDAPVPAPAPPSAPPPAVAASAAVTGSGSEPMSPDGFTPKVPSAA